MSSVAYRNFFSMGTRMDIILPGCDDESADTICLLLKEELKRTEERISIYIPESDLSVINKKAFTESVNSGKEMIELIEKLIFLSEKTLGYFDFTIGKLLKLNKKNNSIGFDEKELKELISKTGVHFIDLNKELNQVSLSSEHIFLDSGGFGKGFGLDMAKKVMHNTKISSYFISFGESSILACGSHPYGDSWKTGIRNIFQESAYICSYEMRDAFLSVSGITPRNIKKYGTGHIINPVTGKPVTRLLHAAVKGDSGLATEAVSTALVVSPDEKREDIMRNFPEYSAIVFEYDKNNFKPEIVYSKNQ